MGVSIHVLCLIEEFAMDLNYELLILIIKKMGPENLVWTIEKSG